MKNILDFAQNVNWGYNTRNNNLFINSASELFMYVQATGANKLTNLTNSSELQMVGKAFSYFARFLDSGDYNINSVAAENAYYCLAKSIRLNNYYAAPELYNLMVNQSELLIDKFVVVRIASFQRENPNTPFSRVWGIGNPIKNPAAREDTKKILPHTRYFIISKFYDIEANKTLMPPDIIEYSQSLLDIDLLAISKKANIQSWLDTGKEYFENVFNEIEEALLK